MTRDRDVRISWFGHACVEIRTARGRTILVDPWFTNPRSTRPPEAVVACDVLLVSHGHADHLGDALGIAARLRPAWPCIHELSLWLRRYAPESAEGIVGCNKGGTVEVAGVRVSMVHADHSGGEWAPVGNDLTYFGDPVGFVIELEDGYRIYHAGDTGLFGDMRLIRDIHRPDLAILPIGGHFTMDPVAAAYAVELLGVAEVLPIHWGTFPILAGTPDELKVALGKRELGHVIVHELAPGESIG